MTDTEANLRDADYDDEIDLRELFVVIWAGRWLIAGITSAAVVLSVVVTLMLPNIYRAEALLAPNGQEGVGGLSALASQYGGLASLAGIDLPAGVGDKASLGLRVLTSRRFISEFIERRNLLVPLMAANGWDTVSRQLEIDDDIYDVSASKWVRKASPPRKTIPSSQEAYEKFVDILEVSEDKETGFVVIAIDHYSPDVAKNWVDWLIEDLNKTIMQNDVEKAEQSIAYLNEQIETTSLKDLQTVFFNLIEEQTKTLMLANVSKEYLYNTIDPAVAPETKTRPQRMLIVFLAAFICFLLACFVQLVNYYILTQGKNRIE